MPIACTSSISTARSPARRSSTQLIRAIVAASPIPVEVGGGIRDRAAIDARARARRAYVVLGTAAVRSPALVEEACRAHPGRVIVAVDARDGVVAVDGWTASGGVTAIELGQRAAGWGAAALLYTDVSRDGLHVGPNVELTAQLARAVVVRGDRVGRRRQPRRSRARCATPASPRSSSGARSTTAGSPSPTAVRTAHAAAFISPQRR